jgi:hypothetical protein
MSHRRIKKTENVFEIGCHFSVRVKEKGNMSHDEGCRLKYR